MKAAAVLVEKFPDLMVFIFSFVLLFPLLKWFSTKKLENRKVGLKQIEIANSIMKSNLDRPSRKQIYLTEQLFESMYNRDFKYSEIQALLKASNPSKAVLLFKKGRRFLQLSRSRKSFVLKKEYRYIKVLGKKVYFIGLTDLLAYFFFAMFGGFSLLVVWYIYETNIWFGKFFFVSNFVWAGLLSIIGMVCLFIALKILTPDGYLRDAKALVNEYHEKNP
jgi:hypothetical protein